MDTCFFIGHRETPDAVLPALKQEIERHIAAYHVQDYVVGSHGNFDALAAKAVIDAKKRHPGVTLTLLLAYHPGERAVSIPDGFDGTCYPPEMEFVPRRLAIIRANQWMICNSSWLIAYVSHPSSGSRAVLEAACKRQRRGLMHVTNLADWNPT